MKNIITSLFIAGIVIILVSCSDYLEKPPSVAVTEDTVFANIIRAETFLWTNYYQGLPFGFPTDWAWPYSRIYESLTESITENGDTGQDFAGCNFYNTGSISPSTSGGVLEDKYEIHWGSIRNSIYFMNMIGKVPDGTPDYKAMLKAESRMIVAVNYYEMFKRYGGIQWVNKEYKLSDDFNLERLSVSKTVDSINHQIELSLADLPAIRTNTTEYGRLTRASALFLRARLYHTAASPLFNTGTPYLEFPEHNDLICYGNYDVSRWQKAADASKAAIDFCAANGMALVNTGNPVLDYRTATRDVIGNTELVFFTRTKYSTGYDYNRGNGFINFLQLPNISTLGGGNNCTLPTQNLVDKYEMQATGKPQSDPTSGFDPTNPYIGLDPRFYATICEHLSKWNGVVTQQWNNRDGVNYGTGRSNLTMQHTGYFLRKFMFEDTWVCDHIWPYMRLADLYLMYAESLNEAQGPQPDCYTYLNMVRNRAGIPSIAIGKTKDQLREIILHEREIELVFEDINFLDFRRTLRGPEKYGNDVYGADIRKNLITGEFTYGREKLESRVWKNNWYLDPFPQYEINKRQGLVQNPGW